MKTNVTDIITDQIMMFFKMLMNVLQKSPAAIPMLFATIQRDRITVNANLDTLEMDGAAKVMQ